MLVATFGPTTEWAGKAITYDAGRFTLEGHGTITAADVLAYDQQGHLVWGYEGLKEWVASQAQAPPPPPAPAGSMMGAAVDGSVVGQPAQKKGGFPAWAIVLIVVAVLVAVVATIYLPTKAFQDDKARESAVKEGIHSIQIGVQSYAVDHNDLYPDPSLVQQGALINETDGSAYIDMWPTNPYTGLPMSPGAGPGDFTYTRTSDGGFQLVGYGEGGAVITLP